MSYPVNVVYGSTGQRSMWNGFDLTNLKPECALGEVAPIHKDIVHEKKKLNGKLRSKFTVRELREDERWGIKYDLILDMMLRDGIIDEDSVVQVGSNGRLREVYLVKEKEAYRIFGKSYHGRYVKND